MTHNSYLLLINDGFHPLGVERDKLRIQTRSEGCTKHLDVFCIDVELRRDGDEAGPKPAGVPSSDWEISSKHRLTSRETYWLISCLCAGEASTKDESIR